MMITVLLVLFSAIYCSDSATDSNPMQYDELYSHGVKAYIEYDWTKTVEHMKSSVSDYKQKLNAREICFKRCQDLEADSSPDYVNDDQMHFFHSLNQHAICRENCMELNNNQPLLHGFNKKLEESMKIGEVHNYIQMSLFKEGKVNEAASHAATNYYLDPQTPSIQSNIEYYQTLDNVTDTDLVSLESQEYRDLYVEGQLLYNQDKLEEMIEKLELSLEKFYEELAKCRALCEGPVQFNDSKVLADAISSLYLKVLDCKQSCPDALGQFRRDDDSNFFGSYFHFIQYGYFKTDRFQKAVKAVTTHRRIEPKNEVARMNSAYYQQLPGISNKDFVEREDVKPILDMLEEERDLLDILNHLLISDDDTNNEELEMHEMMDDSKLLEDDFAMYPIIPKTEQATETNDHEESTTKFTIVESPVDHNGIERVVADGLLTEDQCKGLLELTELCKEGDGYGLKSPHTQKEMFEGLTVLDAAKAAVKKEANYTQVGMYLNSSKSVLEVVREQFNLQDLHFSFTHLVCRTAKDGIQDNRSDLSHPVHADNCILDREAGECLKVSPAFTWRDYSAILYLNDDFEGGEFFFAHSPKDLTPQHQVKPQCGRMVGFSAGKENLHGVHAITKGKRCAVALWFTLDPEYVETTFYEAETLIRGIKI